jgi:hypothetical protein
MQNKARILNLTSLEDVIRALVSKWIIRANYFKTIKYASFVEVPRHAIATLLPWLMGPYLSLVVFSQFLNQCWVKFLVKHCSVLEGHGTYNLFPLSVLFIMQLNMWWKIKCHGLYFGITMDRTLTLYKKGLRFLCDMWDPMRNDFWNRRRHVLNSPLPRCTLIFGLSWNSMDPFMKGCLANVVLIPHHMNGLACLETQRMH